MKPKMKCSSSKTSPAKMNSSAGKALVKSPKLRKSQQKVEEVCQIYFMKLRSGLLIEKKACYFKKETTRRHVPKPGGKQHLVLAACEQQLEHLEQSVEGFTFDVPMIQRCARSTAGPIFEDPVLFRCYPSQCSSSETGDGVDGQKLMVNLSPKKYKDFLLHANNKEHSVELQKCENPFPDQAFFLMHKTSSRCVSFECKNNPGVFIGVKDKHLALIKVGEQTEPSSRQNIIFKLST
uniref:Interleukin-33 n=1 Tax=Equus asinus TaxID=9793 RepID=A0A8C4LZN7_EQUAS